LLRELADKGAKETTIDLIGRLALTRPEERLTIGLENTLRCMASGPVHRVLSDGLSYAERAALLDLDERGYTAESSITARALLCVKERWVLMKSVKSFYSKCRSMADGHLEVKPG
jgi:hypothetical protein